MGRSDRRGGRRGAGGGVAPGGSAHARAPHLGRGGGRGGRGRGGARGAGRRFRARGRMAVAGGVGRGARGASWPEGDSEATRCTSPGWDPIWEGDWARRECRMPWPSEAPVSETFIIARGRGLVRPSRSPFTLLSHSPAHSQQA